MTRDIDQHQRLEPPGTEAAKPRNAESAPDAAQEPSPPSPPQPSNSRAFGKHPKSSGPSIHFALPFPSHSTLLSSAAREPGDLPPSAFADFGLGTFPLGELPINSIFQLGYSIVFQLHRPDCRQATFSNSSRKIYFGPVFLSNRANSPWLAPSYADRQAHPSAAEASSDSFTNPASRVRAEAYLSANLTA
jgi:hypothetical protein